MIPPILPRLRSRLTDVLAAAVYGLDADREAARGLAEVCRRQQREIGELRDALDRALGLLAESRRIAGEQEDRARDAEAARVTDAEAWQTRLMESTTMVPRAEDIAHAKRWAGHLTIDLRYSSATVTLDPLQRAFVSALLLRLARVEVP